MAHKAGLPPTLLERLRRIFSLPSVYAQGMTPYASLYTVTNADEDGFVYATGTTNAQSGCNCHDVNTYTTLTLPGGRWDGDTRFGAGEVAQATVVMQLLPSDESGFMQASTQHNAYCPISQAQFVNGEQTAQNNALQKIRAYYKCAVVSNGQCVSGQHPFFPSTQVYTHDRCNPGNICNRLYSRNNSWLFTLQTVWQTSVGAGIQCAAIGPPDAQMRIACVSPDIIP